VIFGEQSPTLTVNAAVLNASFVAGDDVTNDDAAVAASAGISGFVALTVNP